MTDRRSALCRLVIGWRGPAPGSHARGREKRAHWRQRQARACALQLNLPSCSAHSASQSSSTGDAQRGTWQVAARRNAWLFRRGGGTWLFTCSWLFRVRQNDVSPTLNIDVKKSSASAMFCVGTVRCSSLYHCLSRRSSSILLSSDPMFCNARRRRVKGVVGVSDVVVHARSPSRRHGSVCCRV